MRYKKLLLAMALSWLTSPSHATFPTVNSMFQNFAPIAPTRAPELNTLILSINALARYPAVQNDALLTLVPLADGSLWAASEGPMRQTLSVIGERLLTIEDGEETGYAAGDENATVLDNMPSDIGQDEKISTPAVKSNVTTIVTEKSTSPSTATSTSASTATSTVTSTETVATSDNTDKIDTTSTVKLPDLSQATKVHAVWGQLLGDHVDQSVRGGLPAYNANVAGGVIGRDLFLAPNMIVGVAGGYQHARVIQEDLSGSFFTINRYQGTVYGRYHLCDWPIYMIGAATLAANRYENSRYILVPPTATTSLFSVIANAEFTGWESNLYLENGYIWKCGNFRAMPKVILSYSHLDVDSYNESDALALNLTVKYQDMNDLSLGVGGKIDYRNRFQKAYVIPEAHIFFFHDFINDAQISTAEFFSGGYAFLSQGPVPAPNTMEIGASLAVHSYKNVVIKLQYDYTAREDYHRHGAFIKMRYEWA